MNESAYPLRRITAVLSQAELPPSYRIIPDHHLQSSLGTTPADSRFCSRSDDYTMLYASPCFATAFIETVVRDRFVRGRNREIAFREIAERAWVRISTKSGMTLTLLDFRRDGCVRIGAPTDTVNARNHAEGRAFGRSIHANYPNIEGLLYASRLTGADVYAVFGRGIDKLASKASGKLIDHQELPDVLAKHDLVLNVNFRSRSNGLFFQAAP